MPLDCVIRAPGSRYASKHRTVLDVPQDLSQPALFSQPEAPTLLGCTRQLMYLARHGKVAVFSFSATPDANWLFLIDVVDGTGERYPVSNGERGSHGAAGV